MIERGITVQVLDHDVWDLLDRHAMLRGLTGVVLLPPQHKSEHPSLQEDLEAIIRSIPVDPIIYGGGWAMTFKHTWPGMPLDKTHNRNYKAKRARAEAKRRKKRLTGRK